MERIKIGDFQTSGIPLNNGYTPNNRNYLLNDNSSSDSFVSRNKKPPIIVTVAAAVVVASAAFVCLAKKGKLGTKCKNLADGLLNFRNKGQSPVNSQPKIDSEDFPKFTGLNVNIDGKPYLNHPVIYCDGRIGYPQKNIDNKMQILGLMPQESVPLHRYAQEDVERQTIFFTSRTSSLADYPQNNCLIKGANQYFIDDYKSIFSGNDPHFAVGKTPDGHAFVEFCVQTGRKDGKGNGDRIIRNICTIVSQDGNFTQPQIDLMKTLGAFENEEYLVNGYFPILDFVQEINLKNPSLEMVHGGISNLSQRDSKPVRISINEKELLSGIQAWANSLGDTVRSNKFLNGYQDLERGQFIYEDLSGVKIPQTEGPGW